jgi:DNA-binding NarL/FixJ family response regulator
MKALIIDDEPPARSALRGLLRAHPEMELAGEADTIQAATKLLGAADYDLVFLDVQLRGARGSISCRWSGPGRGSYLLRRSTNTPSGPLR